MHSAIFTPGMITNEKLWSSVFEKLNPNLPIHFINFDDCDTLSEQINKLHKIKPSPFHLIGFSMGGYIAIEFALQYPQFLASLILISTSAKGYSDSEKLQRIKLIQSANENFPDFISDTRLSHWLSPHHSKQSAILKCLQEMALKAGPAGYTKQQTATLNREDRRELLRKLNTPTLVIHGKDDKLIHYSQAEDLVKSMPRAKLKVIDSSGHMLPLEQAEILATALNAWFLELAR